jgi:8-oxo-dGTP pyrophosphatase MutT (NUDIX family)
MISFKKLEKMISFKKFNENRENDTNISNKGLIFKDGKLLLVKNLGDEYELPGGHQKNGELVIQGLKREIKEELGTDVITHKPKKLTPTRNFFEVTIDTNKIKLSDEHKNFIMCPIKDCFKLNLSKKCKKDLEMLFFGGNSK